jgi:Spy/CpxP family protein refolding chaperone
MIKSLTNLCLAAAFTTALVFAQTSDVNTHTRPSPAQMVQRQVQFRTTLLSLTADQQAQATTIYTNATTAGSTNHASMRAAEAALKTAIQNNDTATIEQTASTLGNLHAQSIAAEAKAEAAFVSMLTPDQKTKYAQIESEHHMGGGPGGFRGTH